MNANAEKWVAALEGDDYEQGRGALCRVNKDTGERTYCCLGVATDLYQKATGNALTELDRYAADALPQSYVIFKSSKGSTNGGTLLPEVQAWLGLRSEGGHFKEPVSGLGLPFTNSLAAENDKGTDFRGIAQIIRDHPEMFE